jgi:hypothetical protein
MGFGRGCPERRSNSSCDTRRTVIADPASKSQYSRPCWSGSMVWTTTASPTAPTGDREASGPDGALCRNGALCRSGIDLACGGSSEMRSGGAHTRRRLLIPLSACPQPYQRPRIGEPSRHQWIHHKEPTAEATRHSSAAISTVLLTSYFPLPLTWTATRTALSILSSAGSRPISRPIHRASPTAVGTKASAARPRLAALSVIQTGRAP